MVERNDLADEVLDAVIALIADLGQTEIELTAKKDDIEIKIDINARYIKESGDSHDYCTKCTIKPIAKEHMCEECYTEHCQWLRELSAPKQDGDQWYTLYESKV